MSNLDVQKALQLSKKIVFRVFDLDGEPKGQWCDIIAWRWRDLDGNDTWDIIVEIETSQPLLGKYGYLPDIMKCLNQAIDGDYEIHVTAKIYVGFGSWSEHADSYADVECYIDVKDGKPSKPRDLIYRRWYELAETEIAKKAFLDGVNILPNDTPTGKQLH